MTILTDEEKKEALKYYAVGWDLRKIADRILANRTSIVYYGVLEEIAWTIADHFEKENDRINKDRKRMEVKMRDDFKDKAIKSDSQKLY